MSKFVLAWNYLWGVAGLRQEDIWLTSFPRAGNTWVRFILCNVIALSELDQQRVDFHFLDQTMPALGDSNLLEPWEYSSIPRFVKTHQPYRPIVFSRPERVVCIIRDPRDVMVSYYHFRRRHLVEPFAGSFASFIRHPKYGLKACISHYRSWRSRCTVLIRYEALKRDTLSEFGRALDLLDIQMAPGILSRAVDRASFDEMHSSEQESGLSRAERFEKGFRFARKGETKQWLSYFSDEDLRFYQTVCEQLGFRKYREPEELA